MIYVLESLEGFYKGLKSQNEAVPENLARAVEEGSGREDLMIVVPEYGFSTLKVCLSRDFRVKGYLPVDRQKLFILGLDRRGVVRIVLNSVDWQSMSTNLDSFGPERVSGFGAGEQFLGGLGENGARREADGGGFEGFGAVRARQDGIGGEMRGVGFGAREGDFYFKEPQEMPMHAQQGSVEPQNADLGRQKFEESQKNEKIENFQNSQNSQFQQNPGQPRHPQTFKLHQDGIGLQIRDQNGLKMGLNVESIPPAEGAINHPQNVNSRHTGVTDSGIDPSNHNLAFAFDSATKENMMNLDNINSNLGPSFGVGGLDARHGAPPKTPECKNEGGMRFHGQKTPQLSIKKKTSKLVHNLDLEGVGEHRGVLGPPRQVDSGFLGLQGSQKFKNEPENQFFKEHQNGSKNPFGVDLKRPRHPRELDLRLEAPLQSKPALKNEKTQKSKKRFREQKVYEVRSTALKSYKLLPEDPSTTPVYTSFFIDFTSDHKNLICALQSIEPPKPPKTSSKHGIGPNTFKNGVSEVRADQNDPNFAQNPKMLKTEIFLFEVIYSAFNGTTKAKGHQTTPINTPNTAYEGQENSKTTKKKKSKNKQKSYPELQISDCVSRLRSSTIMEASAKVTIHEYMAFLVLFQDYCLELWVTIDGSLIKFYEQNLASYFNLGSGDSFFNGFGKEQRIVVNKKNGKLYLSSWTKQVALSLKEANGGDSEWVECDPSGFN